MNGINCSPMTIPNSPNNAISGGAGDFTLSTKYKTPTNNPTTREIKYIFIRYSVKLP